MAFGFEVKNATGDVIVNEAYQNLSLQLKQDFNVAAGGTFSVSKSGCVSPMMCVNATNYVGFYGASVSGSTYTWNLKANSAASGSVYIFDKPHPAHSSTFGMKLMAADGVTEIFNSDNKYLRVAGILDVPWTGSSDLNNTGVYNVSGADASNTSLPSAKYAVCVSMPRCRTTRVADSEFDRVFDGVKTTSTGVYVSQAITIRFLAGGGGLHPGIFAGSGTGTVPALIVNVEGF